MISQNDSYLWLMDFVKHAKGELCEVMMGCREVCNRNGLNHLLERIGEVARSRNKVVLYEWGEQLVIGNTPAV